MKKKYRLEIDIRGYEIRDDGLGVPDVPRWSRKVGFVGHSKLEVIKGMCEVISLVAAELKHMCQDWLK